MCVCVRCGMLKKLKNERFVNSVWNKLNDFIVSVCARKREWANTHIYLDMIKLKCGIQTFRKSHEWSLFLPPSLLLCSLLLLPSYFVFFFLVRFFRRYFVNELSVVQNETIFFFFNFWYAQIERYSCVSVCDTNERITHTLVHVCVFVCLASKARMNSLKKKKWLVASGLMNTINHYT